MITDDAAPSMMWSIVELSAGIVCACLPAIPPVLQSLSKKLRVAASQRSRIRESRGLWYAEPVARGTNGENKPDDDGMYKTWDEELTTLHPAYDNTMCASERPAMCSGAGSVDDSKSIPMTTIHSNKSSNW